jgi:hypothetical protein
MIETSDAFHQMRLSDENIRRFYLEKVFCYENSKRMGRTTRSGVVGHKDVFSETWGNALFGWERA